MMKKKGLIVLSIVMFAVLVGQFIYTIYNNTFEPSSYTDWISAFCNIIMAGATVVAVLAAKNYLAQFTAQEGYKIAIELVNEHIRQISQCERLCEFYIEQRRMIEKYKNVLPTNAITSSIDGNTNRYDLLVTDYNRFVSKFEDYLFKLNTYGLSVSDTKSKDFNSMLSGLREISKSCNDLLEKSRKIVTVMKEQYKENKHNISNYSPSEHGGINFTLSRYDNLMIDELFDIRQVLDNAMLSYRGFISDDNTITKLFNVH
ncbi:TPA: hypothetical protein ACQ317_004146 [Yersinia enterocolitica]